MEEPPSGNFCFSQSTFRSGWDHADSSADEWKQVILSDESSFSQLQGQFMCGVIQRKLIIRNTSSRNETRWWISDGLGSISWNSLGPIVALHGRISSKDYLNIWADHVHPMAHALFPDGKRIFQDDNALVHTAHVIKNWYECELKHIE